MATDETSTFAPGSASVETTAADPAEDLMSTSTPIAITGIKTPVLLHGEIPVRGETSPSGQAEVKYSAVNGNGVMDTGAPRPTDQQLPQAISRSAPKESEVEAQPVAASRNPPRSGSLDPQLATVDLETPQDVEAGPSPRDDVTFSEDHDGIQIDLTKLPLRRKARATLSPGRRSAHAAKKQKIRDDKITTHPPRIEHLGNERTGMCIIRPPPDNPHHPALKLLAKLEAKLRNYKVLRRIEAYINRNEDGDGPESARVIQGKRFEIFLDAKGKSSKAFETILVPALGNNNNNQQTKRILLDFAREQARLDPRVKDGYIFENFSLLVGIRAAPAQAPHVDLVAPNFQFGMVISKNSPGTLFVPEPDKMGRVHRFDQLVHLWETDPYFVDEAFPNVPPRLVRRFQEDKGAQQLLSYFGDTLRPEESLRNSFVSRDKMPLGTLSSLPGGVCHAGPASKAPRSVLFFSGAPINCDEVDPYMPDSQYNGVTLMGHLVSIFWRQPTITTEDRQFLLRKLAKYVQSSSSVDVAAQFGEGKLKDCVKALQNKSYSKGRRQMTLEDFIKERSIDLSIVVGNDPFSQTNSVIDVQDMQLVSLADDLFTPWKHEGEDVERDLHVIVYRRISDHKIVLRYKTDGDDSVSPDEYEGHLDSDNFRLELDEPGSAFDGTNGRLFGTDGKQIEVHKGRRKYTKSN